MRVNQYCEEVSKGISHLVFPLSRLIRSRERHIRGNIDFSQQKKKKLWENTNDYEKADKLF